jgi:superfamily II DNA/RNA helicase
VIYGFQLLLSNSNLRRYTMVSHVILFDFPRDPSEYVRRVGRTARGAMGTGTVSVLVLGRQAGAYTRPLLS